ncbi:MAG: FkbM family methyltransferase [Acidobacteria bacterium]|nr:FkbM family methyltransferase [Acidobacteriota bacterium]
MRRLAKLIPRQARSWLRSPGRSLNWLTDEAQYRLGIDVSLDVSPGLALRCHPLAYRVAYKPVMDDPEQQRELTGFLRLCRRDMVLFDIGAHFGVFSIAAAQKAGPGARIVAVDPSPVAVRMLRIQTGLNKVSEQVEIVEACVGDTVGEKQMVAAGVVGIGYYVEPTTGHTDAEKSRIRKVTLASLASDRAVLPTHVKVDVESLEEDVLRGGAEIFESDNKPLLFLELHNQIMLDRGSDPAGPLDLLERFGYRLFDHSGHNELSRTFISAQPLIRVIARPSGPEPADDRT